MAKSEIAALLEQVRAEGGSYQPTKKGHLAVDCPDGQRVIIPSTASDYRSVRNSVAELRRHGYVLRAEHELRRSSRPSGRRQPAPRAPRVEPFRPRSRDGKVRGTVKPAPEPEGSAWADLRARFPAPTRKAAVTWTLADAFQMVRAGYSPEHAARLTGYDVEVVRSAAA